MAIRITQEKLSDLVSFDLEHRKAGVTDGLLTIFPKFEWTTPILTFSHQPGSVSNAPDPNDIITNLKASFDGVHLLLDDPHFVIAGGAVVNAALKRNTHDVDIFVVGFDDVQSATDHVEQMAQKLLVHWEASFQTPLQDIEYLDDEPFILLNSNSLTLSNGELVFQFIFRLYQTLEEILFGFDLPACAIGVSSCKAGEVTCFFTPLCAMALTTNVCLVNPQHASPSFYARMTKYYSKGFDLAFWGSDDYLPTPLQPPIKKAKHYKHVYFGNASFRLHENTEKQWVVDESRLSLSHAVGDDDADYESVCYTNVLWTKRSFLNLAKRVPFPVHHFHPCNTSFSFSAMKPCLFPKDIDEMCDDFSRRLKMNGSMFQVSLTFVFRALCQFNNFYPVLAKDDVPRCLRKVKHLKNELKQRLASLPSTPSPYWVTESPGKQHTASFHPTPLTAKQMYDGVFDKFK